MEPDLKSRLCHSNRFPFLGNGPLFGPGVPLFALRPLSLRGLLSVLCPFTPWSVVVFGPMGVPGGIPGTTGLGKLRGGVLGDALGGS